MFSLEQCQPKANVCLTTQHQTATYPEILDYTLGDKFKAWYRHYLAQDCAKSR